MNKKTITYKDAGVDINAANTFIELIKPLSAATSREGVQANLGGFGAFCEIPKRYSNPVLVASTDGVGTKLRLAIEWDDYSTIGIDLVAMCVNDIITSGAEPLFFLDYYASSHLDIAIGEKIIAGIANGCKQAGCALIGGETAELPGLYQNKDFDLAGFVVGVAEKARIVNTNKIAANDCLIAIASSGAHSNGYSLIRKILEDCPTISAQRKVDLLTPTKTYVDSILSLIRKIPIHGVAHITGGGLTENMPRMLQSDLVIDIDLDTWKLNDLFCWIKRKANIDSAEMLRTFNCGVGMVVCVSAQYVDMALEILKENNEQAWQIGRIIQPQAGGAAARTVNYVGRLK